MSSDDLTEARGTQMPDEEIDAFLREQGFGALALSDDGRSCAVPVSFGYDEERERCYLSLVRFGDDSEKLRFAETTTSAALLCYDVESRFEWRSAVVRGPLEPVPEDERDHVESVMDDNAWFPSLFPPSEPITAVERVALVVEAVSGRHSSEG
jgi:nitroimidazol reductase NimA-like FMN-containing flavoprotein (pyridoxamine 5'-phosphate oxidase superfamily)